MKVVESRKISVETDYKNKYEGILLEKLNEMRDSHEFDMQSFREETETLYRSKVLCCQLKTVSLLYAAHAFISKDYDCYRWHWKCWWKWCLKGTGLFHQLVTQNLSTTSGKRIEHCWDIQNIKAVPWYDAFPFTICLPVLMVSSDSALGEADWRFAETSWPRPEALWWDDQQQRNWEPGATENHQRCPPWLWRLDGCQVGSGCWTDSLQEATWRRRAEVYCNEWHLKRKMLGLVGSLILELSILWGFAHGEPFPCSRTYFDQRYWC